MLSSKAKGSNQSDSTAADTLPFHSMNIAETCAQLQTSVKSGLGDEEANRRLLYYGSNEISSTKRRSALVLLLRQFATPLMLILLVGATISAYTSDITDAIAIVAIVVINAFVSFLQEYKAEKALADLGKMSAPQCFVRRSGVWQQEPASRLVPGDIVRLKAGDIVPADLRLVECSRLQIDEAALTGESEPVDKSATATVAEAAQIGDRETLVFMSTQVTQGTGHGIVYATGMHTEVGQIARMMGDAAQPQTPLQKRISSLSRILIFAALAIVFVVGGFGYLHGMDRLEIFNTAIALSVSAIPEGLPTIVTIVLTIGSRSMARQNALARRLASVETLGTTTVICTDKTGTLTQNQMQVMRIWSGGKLWRVTGKGFEPKGTFLDTHDHEAHVPAEKDLRHLLQISVLCNEAELVEIDGRYSIQGNPTEGALVVAAAKAGLSRDTLIQDEFRPLASFPFDSTRKMMSLHAEHCSGVPLLLVKGAPDMIVARATHVRINGEELPLTDSLRSDIGEVIRSFGHDALRTLAIAYRRAGGEEINPDQPEQDLVLLGIHGIMDPPRQEVPQAVREAQGAGIRTIMITGDHAVTAQAIGNLIGLRAIEGKTIYTGAELDKMSPDELEEAVQSASVFARVTPAHKLRIVSALQHNGEVAAMTGDGVNDAPALKKADIGIAMGITGTSVAKDSASLVLLDDNFATIVNAIREGRRIYDNLRKFLRQALTANVAEVSIILFAFVLMGSEPLLPVTPLMILWVNLVSDGIPALTLGFEPGEKDLMDRAPRGSREGVFSDNLHLIILSRGVAVGGISFLMFMLGQAQAFSFEACQTMAFATLVFAQLWHLFDARSHFTLFDRDPLSNPYLLIAVGCSLLLSLTAIYSPLGHMVLHTEALDLASLLQCLVMASLPTLLLSTLKRSLNWRFV